MGIVVSTGEVVEAIDTVTTVREILTSFPEVSRGALRNWMGKDVFNWRVSGRTILIDREQFAEWYRSRNPLGLDSTDRSV